LLLNIEIVVYAYGRQTYTARALHAPAGCPKKHYGPSNSNKLLLLIYVINCQQLSATASNCQQLPAAASNYDNQLDYSLLTGNQTILKV
jgi:hypothetical protein